jgi:hypothetical protein
MPKPVPLDSDLRRRIGDDIAMHVAGRNELARRYGFSPGVVTKIARERGLYFEGDWQTTTATECHRADAELARLNREEEIWAAILNRQPVYRYRDGRETRASRREGRRLHRALYDLHRHHR